MTHIHQRCYLAIRLHSEELRDQFDETVQTTGECYQMNLAAIRCVMLHCAVVRCSNGSSELPIRI